MKIKINTKELAKVVKTLYSVIDKKDSSGTIFFEADDERLVLTAVANDKRLSIIVSGEVLEQGKICFDALKLYRFCTKIKVNEDVVIKHDTGVANATLETGAFSMNIPVFDCQDYPDETDIRWWQESCIIPGFIEALNFVKIAMSDCGVKTGYTGCVNFRCEDGTIKVMATNGHILIKKDIQSENFINFTVPNSSVNLITKIFSNEDLLISFNKETIKIETKKEFLTVRLKQEGTPLNYQKIIDPLLNVDFNYKIDGKSLASAISSLDDNSKNNLIQLNWDGQCNLKLESSIGTFNTKSDGKKLKTTFNGRYLKDICNKFGNCEFSFKNDSIGSPVLIKSEQGICVMMPTNDFCKIN